MHPFNAGRGDYKSVEMDVSRGAHACGTATRDVYYALGSLLQNAFFGSFITHPQHTRSLHAHACTLSLVVSRYTL